MGKLMGKAAALCAAAACLWASIPAAQAYGDPEGYGHYGAWERGDSDGGRWHREQRERREREFARQKSEHLFRQEQALRSKEAQARRRGDWREARELARERMDLESERSYWLRKAQGWR